MTKAEEKTYIVRRDKRYAALMRARRAEMEMEWLPGTAPDPNRRVCEPCMWGHTNTECSQTRVLTDWPGLSFPPQKLYLCDPHRAEGMARGYVR